MKFVQTTSIVRQIQGLTLALGVFLLLESAGTYLFSRSFLEDLKTLRQINLMTVESTQASDNIVSIRDMIERLRSERKLNSRQLLLNFEANYEQALQATDSALKNSQTEFGKPLRQLQEARESLLLVNRRCRLLLRSYPPEGASENKSFRKDLLLARQAELDAIESLRSAQFELNRSGKDIFSNIYGARFTPFLISLSLALFFFAFIVYFGFTRTRRLKRSLDNLLLATDQVGRGNLQIKIPTLSTDEIGQLTSAFDSMTQNLEKSMKDAQNAVKIRDEFLSIASHELKTPITSLKMQLQFARRQVKVEEGLMPTPEKLARAFDTSIVQVERLISLVEDLLDVSRIESGKLSFSFEQTDLTEMVRGVLERFADALKGSSCTPRFQLTQRVLAWCDPFRIEQVFINLLSNAMKYSPRTPIDISVEENGGVARIRVRDYGFGIPAEMQSRIFNRFERVSSTQNISGLGLGLYISKQIVDAHRGRIWVETPDGPGSLFTVELPQQPPTNA